MWLEDDDFAQHPAPPETKAGAGHCGDSGGQKKTCPAKKPKQVTCIRFSRISIAPAS
jgi:hypothetical protein